MPGTLARVCNEVPSPFRKHVCMLDYRHARRASFWFRFYGSELRARALHMSAASNSVFTARHATRVSQNNTAFGVVTYSDGGCDQKDVSGEWFIVFSVVFLACPCVYAFTLHGNTGLYAQFGWQ